MAITLTDKECRVIGVLLEKSITTPEQYPLTINALTNGCNQKSNRAPLMNLTEEEVKTILAALNTKRLIQVSTGFGSRVDKITQRFCNTEFGELKLTEQQTAIMTELLLRGPQTPGELRGRCQRMARFSDMADVESSLASLQAYQPDPLVEQLPREPGKREARYAHLFTEFNSVRSAVNISSTDSEQHIQAPEEDTQLNHLLNKVEQLSTQVCELTARLEILERKNH
ncbi:DUF480 domain-containing protein [Alteromonas aestuariivivens]|uniref:DUF480 domain-containing protein n=1 Tax=Alteromonas aestuariivivens TaxID=1938339 RepID=A0A3D8M4G1_9ALTE|nr:DUF480 domain-containing protein [Alteromonas aestuariivivens]RDV24460.1 DUF480 domain-containing protein [Alteromonas aestuariivivens]